MTESAGSLYAPMLIGTFLNCILYGATVVQIFVYFQTFKNDKWWMKMFVLYLLFFETINTAFDIGVVYEPFVARYGTPHVTEFAPLMLASHPILTVIISLPVQLFIAWRVKVMSKSSILYYIISFLAIAAFIGGIATAASLIHVNFEYSRFHQNDGAVTTWLAASAAADVLITASLVYSLSQKRTGFAATDDVVNRIIRLTVQTGLVTAVTATVDITLYLLFEAKMWNFVWDFTLSKLYSNTLLSSLNARSGWKGVPTARDNVLFGNGTGGGSTTKSRPQIEIVTTVTTEYESRHHISSPVPMKVFDAAADDARDASDSASVVHVPTYGEAV